MNDSLFEQEDIDSVWEIDTKAGAYKDPNARYTLVYGMDEMAYPSLYLIKVENVKPALKAYRSGKWSQFRKLVVFKVRGQSLDLWEEVCTIGITFNGPIGTIK